MWFHYTRSDLASQERSTGATRRDAGRFGPCAQEQGRFNADSTEKGCIRGPACAGPRKGAHSRPDFSLRERWIPAHSAVRDFKARFRRFHSRWIHRARRRLQAESTKSKLGVIRRSRVSHGSPCAGECPRLPSCDFCDPADAGRASVGSQKECPIREICGETFPASHRAGPPWRSNRKQSALMSLSMGIS